MFIIYIYLNICIYLICNLYVHHRSNLLNNLNMLYIQFYTFDEK